MKKKKHVFVYLVYVWTARRVKRVTRGVQSKDIAVNTVRFLWVPHKILRNRLLSFLWTNTNAA